MNSRSLFSNLFTSIQLDPNPIERSNEEGLGVHGDQDEP